MSYCWCVNLWIPERAGREAIGKLPQGVSLGVIPRAGELPPAICEAEFLVPGAGDTRIPELLPRARALRVIQTRLWPASTGCWRLSPRA